MPKRTSDDRALLMECLTYLRELSVSSTVWASLLSSTRLTNAEKERIIAEMDRASEYIDTNIAHILMRMRNVPPVQVYQGEGMSMWIKPEGDSYE